MLDVDCIICKFDYGLVCKLVLVIFYTWYGSDYDGNA